MSSRREPRHSCNPRRGADDDRHRNPHRRRTDRPQPLARALRPVRRDADDRARRDDRERRAAVDPGGPRVLPEQPRLGRQRLSHRLRRAAAARRAARRPRRPAARLPDRPDDLHRRLGRLRAGAERDDARRRALHPGRRRGADLGRGPRDDRHDVPRPARPGEGARRLRVRGLRGRVDRPPGRRRPHRRDQLALDLPREPADRRRWSPSARCASSRTAPASACGRAPTSPAPSC